MANQNIVGGQYHREIERGELGNKHRSHIKQCLKEHGSVAVRELERRTSKGPRTGRFYTYRGGKYQASSPGEAPAYRSGRLNKSFKFKARTTELKIYNTARSDKGFNYPIWLEETANRPYFASGIESVSGELYSSLQYQGDF